MPYKINPYRHIRKQYNADWQHNDPQEYMDFTAVAVFGRRKWDGDECDDGHETWAYIRTSRPITREEFEEMCYDTFRRGCSCEYDCCGHYFGGARTYRAKHNRRMTKWAVPLHYSPNL